MLVLIVCGMLAGEKTLRGILDWADKNRKWLQDHLEMVNIPSLSTLSRILAGVDKLEMELAFLDWICSIVNFRGITCAIDGKALRGGARKSHDETPLYVLNLVDVETKIVLVQISISSKTNEITAIPELLELFQVEGNLFTIDAIGTQVEIARQIDENGGYYLLQVKRNQPILHDELMAKDQKDEEARKINKKRSEDPNNTHKEDLPTADTHDDLEKNRGRLEHRVNKVWGKSAGFGKRTLEFQGVQTVGTMCRTRRPTHWGKDGNEDTISEAELQEREAESDQKEAPNQKIGYISNMELTAEEAADIIRGHWTIEDSVHYVLDELLGEDKSTCRNGQYILAILRKYVYNILRLYVIMEGQQLDPAKVMTAALSNFKDKVDNGFPLIDRYVIQGIPALY